MKTRFLVIPPFRIEKKDTDVDFLFPLKGFCVGFKHEYDYQDIPSDSYVYVNRLLDTSSLEALGNILEESSFRGIVFEDLGVLEYIREKELEIETILYATHASCSLKTVDTYLDYCDTVVLSLDITKEEIDLIVSQAKRPVSLYIYGPIAYMYSRRTLLSNYENHFDLPVNKELSLEEEMTRKAFLGIENAFGTVLFDKCLFDGRILMENEGIRYALVNLDWEEDLDFDGWFREFFFFFFLPNTTDAFLQQKTIYRLPPKGSSS